MGDHRGAAVRRQVVLAAAHEGGGRILSCAQCQECCQQRWGLELERHEVSAAIGELVHDRKLLHDGTCYVLTAASGRELAERVRVSKEIEATAFGEWEQTVRRKNPSLGGEHVAQLREDLAAWIQRIVVERGIEAAVLLYPEQERFRHRLEEIKAMGFELLPKRSRSVMFARPSALRAFIDFMTPMQRRYFDNLMTTAYLMSVFTLDPSALDAMRKVTNGHVRYLDTNVIYAMLKLNGPEEYLRTRRTLVLTRRLGYQTCVTPWTLAEMRKSVRSARLRLARRPSPQALAELTRHAPGDDDRVFASAYRRWHRETGISFDDFFALHEQVMPLLESEGIEVVSTGCPAIDARGAELDAEIAALERVRQGPEKPRPLQEHDVKHRLLVDALRGEHEPQHLSEAGHLLLTNDHALIRYAEASCRRPEEIPFAVSLTQWAEIVRSLAPRTSDYDRTMTEILDTPALRPRGIVSQAEIVDAVARINVYEGYSDTLSARVLLDAALSGEERAPAPAPPQRDSSEAQATLEAQLRALEEQLAIEREARTAAEAQLAHERRARRRAERRSEQTSRRVAPRREAGDGAGAPARPAPGGRSEEAELERQLRRLQRTVRWLVAAPIVLAGVAALAVPLGSGWIAGGRPLAGDVCGSGAIMVGAFAWLYGSRRAGALVAAIGVVLGIVVAVQTVVS